MTISRKVVFRFLAAGDVIPFGKKVVNPHYIKIRDKKYYLSNDGGPLGTAEEMEELAGSGRVIIGPGAGKFKYLWILDTDKKVVVMWRSTDGNEKLWDHSSAMAHKIVLLDKKGQINRVTHEEFRVIDRHMKDLQDDELKALKKSIADNETDFQKRVNEETKVFFEKFVAPDIEKALSDIDAGAIPFGWKPFHPEGQERQKRSHAMSTIMGKKFTVPLVEAYLKTKGLDIETGGDLQAAEWAVNEEMYAAYDRYLPR